MKTYNCHKSVEAIQIRAIDYRADDARIPVVTCSDGMDYQLPANSASRYRPIPGDYLVRYSNGYLAFSPRIEFEEGYHLQPEDQSAKIRSLVRKLSETGDMQAEKLAAIADQIVDLTEFGRPER